MNIVAAYVERVLETTLKIYRPKIKWLILARSWFNSALVAEPHSVFDNEMYQGSTGQEIQLQNRILATANKK
jgi:hypothetical protein